MKRKKIIILTTDTLHHSFFVQQILEKRDVEKVIIEKNSILPPFDIYHPFENKQGEYEKQNFFNNKNVKVSDLTDVVESDTINDSNIINLIKKISPDIIVIFGTRKISDDLIRQCPEGIINLHGGNPEEYRGLDTHLWAIYHRDYANLTTTLHRVVNKIDAGDIIFKKKIKIFKNMKFHSLRYYNTKICIELTLSALDMFEQIGNFRGKPLRKLGRYYSFMPSVLKDICVKRFNKYSEDL